jgi:hypothetical protein
MGSASLAAQLIEHYLLDEYRLMIEPILLAASKCSPATVRPAHSSWFRQRQRVPAFSSAPTARPAVHKSSGRAGCVIIFIDSQNDSLLSSDSQSPVVCHNVEARYRRHPTGLPERAPGPAKRPCGQRHNRYALVQVTGGNWGPGDMNAKGGA